MSEEMNDRNNTIAAEELQENMSESDYMKDAMNTIRRITENEQPAESHVTPEQRAKGDSVFGNLLVGGLLAAGFIMILIAAFAKGHSELIVGGIIFCLMGFLLNFISKNVKKD